MRILVTGGAGFIGSHVADAYIARGHEVAVVDDLSRGVLDNVHPEAHFLSGDIRDREFVKAVFSEFNPEVLNHHAAQMDVRRGVREPVFDASVNILGSLNLLEEAVASGTRHIIYIASAGAGYGEPACSTVSEDYPIRPVTPYGISKHTVEHYLFAYEHLYGISYVVLRYGNVYGPRQSSQGEAGVFAVFSEQILNGIQPVIFGDGTKTRDYIYVDDVVRANVLALEKGYGQIFNIASQVETTDLEVFSTVARLLGNSQLRPRYEPVRPGEIEHICLDITKAKEILGWRPRITFDDGAQRTVNHFRHALGIGRRVTA